MAVWHFILHLVDQDDYNNVASTIQSENFSDILGNLLVSRKISLEISKEFSTILPPEPSWSKNILQWGKSDSTHITCYVNKYIQEITIYLDLRINNSILIKNIFEIINRYPFLMVNDRGQIIEPNLSTLKREILASNAYQFVDNPKKYLSNLE